MWNMLFKDVNSFELVMWKFLEKVLMLVAVFEKVVWNFEKDVWNVATLLSIEELKRLAYDIMSVLRVFFFSGCLIMIIKMHLLRVVLHDVKHIVF